VDKIMILQGGKVAFLGPRAEAFARFVRPVASSGPQAVTG